VLEFVPRAPAGEELRGLEVAINGHRRRTVAGAALDRALRLPLAEAELTRVTLVGQTADGRVLSATRDYPPGG
jgi:hypothetical protein